MCLIKRCVMKIFQTEQIKRIDALTSQYESIASYHLMERASRAFFEELLRRVDDSVTFCVVAGSGNNGGDALVVARLLKMIGRNVIVYLVNPKNALSVDCSTAYENLISRFPDCVVTVTSVEQISIDADCVIDGLFGSGLNRPLSGLYKSIVEKINDSNKFVVSIDLPSGLFGEDNSENDREAIVKSSLTLTFQFPKLSFLLPDNEIFLGEWKVLDIQLHPRAMQEIDSSFFMTDECVARSLLKVRGRFSHKGTYGHALLVAGSKGMTGAAVLAAKSALRSGCGLLSVRVPDSCREILQITVPEAIVNPDPSNEFFSAVPDLSKYNAVGIGPGLGLSDETRITLKSLLEALDNKPFVMDADALNILGMDPSLWTTLPENAILTPHPKEFERISGRKTVGYERWMAQLDLSVKHKVVIVLKGAYTSVSLPDGTLHFNTTGNAGMATAGSGDTLTGIILSLLAQGYDAADAARLGVWLHGRAGDLALCEQSEESLLASDITACLGKAFSTLKM